MAIITRPEFIKMVSEKINRRYSQDEIYWIVKGVFLCFEEILRNGDTLKIADCFTMKPVLKSERQFSNFGKGKVTIPEHYIPVFKPYKKLRDACLEITSKEKSEDEEK